MGRSKRQSVPPSERGLNEKLAAIGVMIAAESMSRAEIQRVDIEETLVDAAVALASPNGHLRLLGPILSWIAVHGSAVIVEKLIKILLHRKAIGADVQFAGLLAGMAMLHGHKRWSIVAERFSPDPSIPRSVGPPDLVASMLHLKGEEEWARKVAFLLPKGSGTINQKWVLSRHALAKQHHQYRNRLIYGGQWRSDIITAYELGARTAAEASRISGASYEPCHRVKDELEAAGVLRIAER